MGTGTDIETADVLDSGPETWLGPGVGPEPGTGTWIGMGTELEFGTATATETATGIETGMDPEIDPAAEFEVEIACKGMEFIPSSGRDPRRAGPFVHSSHGQ